MLKEVLATQAATKHPQLVHSIWALVNHLAVWVGVAADRITEWRSITEPDAGNFPPVTDTSDAGWAAALDDLDRQHRKLLDVVAELDAAKLDAVVPGKDYPVAVMLHGTAQHFAYPLVLGTGKKLFSDGFALSTFTLAESRALKSGVLINTYRSYSMLLSGVLPLHVRGCWVVDLVLGKQ